MSEQTENCAELISGLRENQADMNEAYAEMQSSSNLAAAMAFDLLVSVASDLMGKLSICARQSRDTDVLRSIRAVTVYLDRVDDFSDRTLALYQANRTSMAHRYQRNLQLYLSWWNEKFNKFFPAE